MPRVWRNEIKAVSREDLEELVEDMAHILYSRKLLTMPEFAEYSLVSRSRLSDIYMEFYSHGIIEPIPFGDQAYVFDEETH